MFDTWYNHNNSLEEVYIGRNIVTGGGHSAFANEHIKTLTLGENVTRVEDEAFRGCRGLRNVTLSPNLTHIGRQAFYECDTLATISIPDGVVEMGKEAFVYCRGLETVKMPASLKVLEQGTFYDCHSLKEISIPAAVDTIGYQAFYNCYSLQKLTIEDCVNPLKLNGTSGNYWGMFDTWYNHNNSLEEVYVGRNLRVAGGHCPFNNENIVKLTLGENVSELKGEDYAFCSKLDEIHCLNVVPPVCSGPNVFKDVSRMTCGLYVPEGSVDAYKAAFVWSDFFNIVSGMKEVLFDGETADDDSSEWYTIDGVRTDKTATGIVFQRTKDGRTQKVLLR